MATSHGREWNRVALIGVGLLGGSVALALRARRLARMIVGIGRSPERLEAARAAGVIDEAADSVEAAVRDADLVIVATPVDAIAELAVAAATHAGSARLVTDVGSTKEEIVAQVEGAAPEAPFVGSHPLAGKTASGWEHAEAELLVDRTVFVTPTQATPSGCVAAAEALWKSLGARVERVDPAEHDAIVAATSHLPHVVASALAAAAPDYPAHYFGSGWRSATRLAAGDAGMWVAILRQNRAAVAKALREAAHELNQWREAIEGDDPARLAEMLSKGRQHCDRLGS